MVDTKLLVISLLQVHLSAQFFANLCFNRRRDIDCSMAGKAYEGGTMDIRSVTILLSSNAQGLQANNDGISCAAIELECRSTIRETTRDTFQDKTILSVYDYIIGTCHGKTTCDLLVPNWDSVNGTTEVCMQRFPDISRFHLRGVYIDIDCQLPMPTTTTMFETNETDSTTNNSTLPIAVTNSTNSRPAPTRHTPASLDPTEKPSRKPTTSPERKESESKNNAPVPVISAASAATSSLIAVLISAFAWLSLCS